MCPDDENPFVDNNNSWIPLGPHVNPFYNYLVELQEKRMRMLEAVEPARHVQWQLSVTALIIIFWSPTIAIMTAILFIVHGLRGSWRQAIAIVTKIYSES